MKVNKILSVILEKGEDGKTPSVAKKDFEPALKNLCNEYKAFYYDDYLKDESCKFKITKGKNLKDLQTDVYLITEKFKPDIIFFNIVKDEFNFKLLNELKKKYTTVNWFADDEWRWENFSKDYCKMFTYIITTSSQAVSKYKNINYNNVILESWGSSKFIDKIEKKIKYVHDVTFIGGWSKERGEIVNYLKEHNIKIECYGYGWPNGLISQEKMEELIYRSRINLNLSNSTFTLKNKIFDKILKIIYQNKILSYICANLYLWKNKNRKKDKYHKEFHNKIRYFKSRAAIKISEQVKARNFEIPAFGGFQLSYYCKDIDIIFNNGIDIVLFNNKEDCLNKIKYYLNFFEERKNIVKNGYNRCKKYYNYNDIFKRIINEVKK